jgi:heme exporter protein CcmD
MDHDPHTGFILAAYTIAAVVIVSMIVAIVSDYWSLKRSLKRFGARGAHEADRG